MGSLFSKSNKINHFASPKKFYDEMSGISSDDDNFLENIDPHSPCLAITRTPLYGNYQQMHDRQHLSDIVHQSNFDETPAKSENPNLKEKLLRKLGYNLKDPRSPSHVIPRTPINLHDTRERSVAVEDSINLTSSIKFKETTSTTFNFKSDLIAVCKDLETSLTEFHLEIDAEKLSGTPEQDPRSPSTGIERTPLFLDHTETSLQDDSNDSNMDEEINKMVNELISDIKVYTRKSIDLKENSYLCDKIVTDNTTKKRFVYEEVDNVKYSTPKAVHHKTADEGYITGNRTPLQCLGNRTQGRINERVKNNNDLSKQISKHKTNFIYNDENDSPHTTKALSKIKGKSKNLIPHSIEN